MGEVLATIVTWRLIPHGTYLWREKGEELSTTGLNVVVSGGLDSKNSSWSDMPMLLSVKSSANWTPGASPAEYDVCRLLIGEVNANILRIDRSAVQVGEKGEGHRASQIE